MDIDKNGKLDKDMCTIVMGTVVGTTTSAWPGYAARHRAHAEWVKVVFECVGEASLTTHLHMHRSTTAAEVTAQAQDLFAGSFPQKMRGVHVQCTVDGYALATPVTLGDVFDAAQSSSSTVRVVCRRVRSAPGQHSST